MLVPKKQFSQCYFLLQGTEYRRTDLILELWISYIEFSVEFVCTVHSTLVY